MSLAGAVITPHPPIIVPEIGGARQPEVDSTIRAMRTLSGLVAEAAPDTLVLLSPHAPLMREAMGVCVAERYEGSFSSFGAPQVRLELEGNPELANAIMRSSLERQVSVRALGGSDGQPFPLDHGALVPLYFLADEIHPAPRLVLLAFSLRSLPSHMDFGEAIVEALAAHLGRVLFVASGDLSHRLRPEAPAGYSPDAAEFDARVVEAVRRDRLEDLLAIPESLRETAGECGYRSLLVLLGMLQDLPYSAQVLSYEGPFGVGYLVAMLDTERSTSGGSLDV